MYNVITYAIYYYYNELFSDITYFLYHIFKKTVVIRVKITHFTFLHHAKTTIIIAYQEYDNAYYIKHLMRYNNPKYLLG